MALEEFRYRYDVRVVFRDVDYYRVLRRRAGQARGSVQSVIIASQRFDYEEQAHNDGRLVMACSDELRGAW